MSVFHSLLENVPRRSNSTLPGYKNNHLEFAYDNKIVIFTTILLILALRSIHGLVAIPRHLRHIPCVSIWGLLKSYLAAEPDDVRIRRLIMPFANRGESVVLVWALGRWMVHILDDTSASEILTDIERYPKELPPDGLLLWRLIGLSNTVMSNGEFWRTHSAVLREGFKSIIPIPTFVNLSRSVIQIIENAGKKTLDFSELAQRFTLDAVSSTVIGYDFDSLHTESDFMSRYNSIMNDIANPLYLLIPGLERIITRKSLANRIDSLAESVMDLLSVKRMNPGQDIMSAMLEDPQMTDQNRRDNTITLFIAGHETSAGAVSSLMFYLAQYPKAQQKAREEVLKILGPSADPTLPELQKLHYLDACIREALRINTPASFILPRISSAVTTLGGYDIPPGTSLVVNFYAIHHSRKNFPHPYDFKPERWLEGNSTGKGSWIPFSRGPRQCPARIFAVSEQKVLLSMLLREYLWHLPEDSRHRSGLKNALSPFAITAPESLGITFTKCNIRHQSIITQFADEVPLVKLRSETSDGLAIASKSISESSFEIADPTALWSARQNMDEAASARMPALPRQINTCLANVVREASNQGTWLDGWSLLAQLCVDSGLHPLLLRDVQACRDVYGKIRKGARCTESIDISMTVVGKSNNNSLNNVGPKGLGGHGWKSNDDYQKLQSKWTTPGFLPMGPCTAFIWLGLQKKIVSSKDADDCNAMQLLSTVDYDFDLLEGNKSGLFSALEICWTNIKGPHHAVKGATLTALISLDLQRSVRGTQQEWADGGHGPWNMGPSDITPSEWVSAAIADCAGLCPFGYQSASEYTLSRTGMFVAMLLANTHDVIFDKGCSNRMSSVFYAAAAGVTTHDMHCAFSTGMVDMIAGRVLNGKKVLYGDSAALVTAAWAPFNGRYRTWERFVKYQRLLRYSGKGKALDIVKNSQVCKVFRASNLINLDLPVDVTWSYALEINNAPSLGKRVTKSQSYSIPHCGDVLNTPGVPRPRLCQKCTLEFETTITRNGHDEILAVPGIPESVLGCTALGIAAAVRRAAIWASSPGCCDTCACEVGNWADSVSYNVLVALMKTEPYTGSAEWLLQCYSVWAVTVYPFSVASLLSGFDLCTELALEKGSMGDRDVVDC